MSDRFVVDNSVVMSWCFKDETNRYADSILDLLVESIALVPAIWHFEVVNVLLVAERRKRISKADSTRFLSLLSRLPIVAETEHPKTLMKDLLGLGRSSKLSSYDAAYIDLAMKQGVPLATSDRRLRRAAKAVDVRLLTS